MEWRHNLVVKGVPFPLLGIAMSPRGNGKFDLWVTDPKSREIRRINFDAQGKLELSPANTDVLYDALLQHDNGYIVVRCREGVAQLSGRAFDHGERWRAELPEADSPRWSLATDGGGRHHVLYSSCNPHDAYRQAHVVAVDTSASEAEMKPFFTVPEDDFCNAQIILPLPERFVVCVRNRGASTIFYLLNTEGEILRSGAFSVHPHTKWAVPLCSAPLENNDMLLGGYKEDSPGVRRAWVCRFDADLNALNGEMLAGEAAEQAVTAFAPQPDGTVLALCPPWRIIRLSPKGLRTHVWETPTALRRNGITAILPAPDGGCFITGRSYTGEGNTAAPTAWLGKIALSEFAEL